MIIPVVVHISIVPAQQSRMRKGPYLIYPNSTTQMTVLWQLENSAVCRILWGVTPACTVGNALTTETGPNIDEHQHIHTLKELTPNRRYYYQVIENGVTHYGSFRSAPPDTADATSFFIYGDTRTYPQMHDSILSGICRTIRSAPSHQTILLHSGDWISSSCETYWDSEYFNRGYANTLEVLSKIPVLGTMGNHEVGGDKSVYEKYWPYPYKSEGFYYSFDYGPVHISVIDQYTNYAPESDQFNWLENDLAWSSKRWKFILLHEPGFSADGAHGNNFNVQTNIQPLCRKYGVKAVFSGHNHFYAHCMVENVHHLTFGGGGAPLYEVYHTGKGLIKSETSLHYGFIKVIHDSAVVSVIRPNGSIIDTFTINETPYPYPPLENEKKYSVFKVYASQSLRTLVIQMSDPENALLNILNIKGRKIISRKLKALRTDIDLSSYPKGVYLIKITMGKLTIPKKIILF